MTRAEITREYAAIQRRWDNAAAARDYVDTVQGPRDAFVERARRATEATGAAWTDTIACFVADLAKHAIDPPAPDIAVLWTVPGTRAHEIVASQSGGGVAYPRVSRPQVACAPMVDAWSYTTALHEFGHVRGYAGGGDTLMSEAAAWEWALGVCVVWAPESHQNLREALQSYMRQRGRARHVPGTMACERVIERSAAMVKTRSRSLDVAMRRFRRSVFERTHGPTAVCGGPRHYYSRPPATEDVDGKPLCAACADDAWTDQTFQRLKRERFDWEHAELQRQLTLREALAHGR